MLRFAVISLTTLAILGTVFYFVVLHAQPNSLASAPATQAIQPTPMATTQSSGSMVGPGFKPWFINLENGRVSSKFTAIEYTPQKDGSFLVDHPISIFYMDKGQYMKVTGDSGLVNCDTAGPKGSSASASNNGLFSAPTSSPKNGSLQHVRVELYPSESATKPTQWMETENIHFDNETLPTMFTESYTDDRGGTVPADQVPVTIRGDEYEFDGYGLTLVWNAEKRLEKLQIYHGKRLEIINPSKLSLPGMSPVEAPKAGIGLVPAAPLLASISPSDVSLALPATKPPVSPTAVQPPVPYRAVFHDQVEIHEGPRTMATADLMTADFFQSGKKPKTSPTTPAGGPNATLKPAPAPMQPAYVPEPPVEKKSPTTKPANGPITIYWTGPLLVTPLKHEPMLPLLPGQSVVRLVGSPVKLTPEGSEVTAASATYRSPDGAVQLTHSAALPLVHLSQTKGLLLSTEGINYDPGTELATLSGPSALAMPVNKKQMTVTWSQQGVLHVIRAPGQPNGVDHVDLTGDVAVSHPLFGLNSRELQLDLDLVPRKGSSDADEQLRLLTAIDNVTCQLIHPGKPAQEIDSDHLIIRTQPTTDKHGVLPREVVADGHVHASTTDESIVAVHLDALLLAKPAAKSTPATEASPDDMGGAVDLESLYASGEVHAMMKNHATADADQLRVTTVDGKQKVDLWGPRGAMLQDGKGSWLSGPVVHLVPDRSGVSVEGPGRMETVRSTSTTRPSKGAPARPVDVAWSDSMTLDGMTNVADVIGHVIVKNVDAVGTVSTINGDKAHIDLMDTPKNTKASKTQPTPSQPDAMGGKQLKMLTLTGHVVGISDLNDAGGNPIRRANLYGDQLIYTAADGTAVIPGPGKLFVENHKPDPKDAASRGAMAIQWSKQLTYDQNTSNITIDGDSRVGFEQEPKAAKSAKPAKPPVPMHLDSQRLIITMAKPAPTTGPAKPGEAGKMQLSHMRSIGQVHFVANGIELYCETVDYDPATSVMTAVGNPGRAINADGTASGYFDQIRYDTASEEIIDGQNIKGRIQK